LPKWIGWLLALAGVSYLVNSFALILSPDFAGMLLPFILMPCFVGELVFASWLTIKGVNVERWRGWIHS